MTQASARYILVNSEGQCNDLKTEIANGTEFGELARILGQLMEFKRRSVLN